MHKTLATSACVRASRRSVVGDTNASKGAVVVGSGACGFPVGLGALLGAQLEEVAAEETEQQADWGQDEEETEHQQDVTDHLSGGMAEPHAGAVKEAERAGANERQDEEERRGREHGLPGEVGNMVPAPEQTGAERQEEHGDRGELLPLARILFEFQPHGCELKRRE